MHLCNPVSKYQRPPRVECFNLFWKLEDPQGHRNQSKLQEKIKNKQRLGLTINYKTADPANHKPP
jgi:hypothetical protein